MKLQKIMCKSWLGTSLLLTTLVSPIAMAGAIYIEPAVTSGIATIQMTITQPKPTCNLTLNGKSTLNYVLGEMSPGTHMKHQPITVQLECPNNAPGVTAAKTAITAKLKPAANTALQPNEDSVRMQVDGSAGIDSSSPLIWLQTDNGNRVKLTGKESDAFCIKNDTSSVAPNVCHLTPVTDIPAQSAIGNFGAVMVIEAIYPQ